MITADVCDVSKEVLHRTPNVIDGTFREMTNSLIQKLNETMGPKELGKHLYQSSLISYEELMTSPLLQTGNHPSAILQEWKDRISYEKPLVIDTMPSLSEEAKEVLSSFSLEQLQAFVQQHSEQLAPTYYQEGGVLRNGVYPTLKDAAREWAGLTDTGSMSLWSDALSADNLRVLIPPDSEVNDLILLLDHTTPNFGEQVNDLLETAKTVLRQSLSESDLTELDSADAYSL